MKEIDLRIGHSGDAIMLIDNLLEAITEINMCELSQVEEGLKALKDSIERGII